MAVLLYKVVSFYCVNFYCDLKTFTVSLRICLSLSINDPAKKNLNKLDLQLIYGEI